jgi:hypothetical protein
MGLRWTLAVRRLVVVAQNRGEGLVWFLSVLPWIYPCSDVVMCRVQCNLHCVNWHARRRSDHVVTLCYRWGEMWSLLVSHCLSCFFRDFHCQLVTRRLPTNTLARCVLCVVTFQLRWNVEPSRKMVENSLVNADAKWHSLRSEISVGKITDTYFRSEGVVFLRERECKMIGLLR